MWKPNRRPSRLLLLAALLCAAESAGAEPAAKPAALTPAAAKPKAAKPKAAKPAPAKPVTPKATADAWSLEALQHLVIETSPLLASDRYRTASSARDVEIARLKHTPRLSLEAGYNDYKKIASVLTYTEPQPYALYNYGTSYRMTLYDGFKKRHAMNVARQGVAVERAREVKDCSELLERFTNAYFDAANARANLDLYGASLAKQQEQLKIVRDLLEHDAGKLLDVRNSELEVERTRGRMQEWSLKYETALGKMGEILGVPRGFWDQLHGFGIAREPERGALVLPDAATDPPAVGLARAEWLKAVAECGEARAEGRPVVSAKADLNHSDKDNGYTMHAPGIAKTLSLNVDWQLNDSRVGRQQVEKKRLDALALKERVTEAVVAQKSRLDGLVRDHEDGRRRYEQNQRIANLQRECLDLIVEEEASGLISSLQRIDAVEKKQSADVDVVTASIEMQRARAQIGILSQFSRPRDEAAGTPPSTPGTPAEPVREQ